MHVTVGLCRRHHPRPAAQCLHLQHACLVHCCDETTLQSINQPSLSGAVSWCYAVVLVLRSGEHMDQFEAFETKRFVSRLLGRGDVSGLMDKIQVWVCGYMCVGAPLGYGRYVVADTVDAHHATQLPLPALHVCCGVGWLIANAVATLYSDCQFRR